MNPLQHLDLLLRYDRALNLQFALKRAVQKGARVLDAGCGTGLLSMWAVQSGAKEVVAVDLGGLDLARELARENCLADSIQFIEHDLKNLDLPHDRNAFDVIVAMIYLNDPRRDESQSELVFELCDRYLATGGQMIPDRVRYLARACDWPAQDHATRLNQIEARVNDLKGRYGLGFEALGNRVAARPWKPFFPARGKDGLLDREGVRVLSEPILFSEIDYREEPTFYPEEREITIIKPGIFNTIIWTQELWFGDLMLFSNESVSWISNPSMMAEDSRCTMSVADNWRQNNLVTIQA